MISAANMWAHLYLSLAAVVGLVMLHMTLRAPTPDDPLTKRFVFGVRVTMAIFVGRAVVVLSGGGVLGGIIVSIAAALVPLAVILLAEGLLRRHAPTWLKLYAAGGAILFMIPGLIPPLWEWLPYAMGLVLFQVLGIGFAGWLVATRDRASLSGAENATASRLALSVLLLVPMIAADYGMVALRMPVQVSALGVLVLCWLAVGLGHTAANNRSVIFSFLALSVISLGTGAFLGWLMDVGREGVILGAAIAMAGTLVVAIYFDARQQRQAGQSLSLLRHMAEGPKDSALAFLTGLRNHPSVDGALIVGDRELADLDTSVLDRLFAVAPVLRRSDSAAADPVLAEHADALFRRYDASHFLQVSAKPRRLVALSMPALGLSQQTEFELQAVQRMAALIAAKEAADA